VQVACGFAHMVALSGTAPAPLNQFQHKMLNQSGVDKGEVYLCGAGCGRLPGMDGDQSKPGIDFTDTITHQKTPYRLEALRGQKILQVGCGMASTIALVPASSSLGMHASVEYPREELRCVPIFLFSGDRIARDAGGEPGPGRVGAAGQLQRVAGRARVSGDAVLAALPQGSGLCPPPSLYWWSMEVDRSVYLRWWI
jgi:hypothetical protein